MAKNATRLSIQHNIIFLKLYFTYGQRFCLKIMKIKYYSNLSESGDVTVFANIYTDFNKKKKEPKRL